ncbi:MAG: Ig-like domain-containing protein [Clostridium sp.]|nr:Ig-like domain-containing protein [Clostridium sp.]
MQKINREKKYISVILSLCLCFCQLPSTAIHTYAAEYTQSVVVQEIDLGDYQSQMTVGEKQLLSVTILPEEAAGQAITYSSSDPSVAKINGMGRITALKEGVTEIVVSCGGVSEKFGVTVVNSQVAVRDIDLGDCPKELEIGASQLLSVTIIPEEASGAKITYQSGNTDIATVNEIGRVTGVKEGTVTITVSSGGVQKDFKLKVVKAKSEEIPVTDIEIADYEEELEVDKTMTLSVTVLPSDATDAAVKYVSSNEKIATVNSSGEVKGIAQGDVTITVSAGAVTKTVKLKVKVATSQIEMDTTYLVLQPGESHQLTAKVIPAEADQQITYESMEPEIVSVTTGGLVTANQCGTGTILVKNGDTSTAVTIIVDLMEKEESEQEQEDYREKTEEYEHEIYAKDYPLVDSDMLKYFYEHNENLTVYGSGYTIKVNGGEIKNWENELYTELALEKEEQGTAFELNCGKNICGSVLIQFDKEVLSGKYVYLYNTSKGKYELLKGQDVGSMRLDTEGKYLVTEKKLPDGKGGLILFVMAIVVVIILLGVYIAVKKKYWFW